MRLRMLRARAWEAQEITKGHRDRGDPLCKVSLWNPALSDKRPTATALRSSPAALVHADGLDIQQPITDSRDWLRTEKASRDRAGAKVQGRFDRTYRPRQTDWRPR